MATTRRVGRLLPARAVRFFRRRLLPLAAGRARFFAQGPEPEPESYFVERTRTVQGRADFETLGCATPGELAERLADRWRAEGHDDLVALAPRFAKLSASLRRDDTPDEQEVSPFVYVMY